MQTDIVIPDKNEKDFIKRAIELGYEAIIFYYDDPKDIKKPKSEKIKVALASTSNKKNVDIVISKAGDNPRPIIERGKANIIYGFEDNGPKEFMHHRNSGLNQVLCKIMHDKKIAIGFDFSTLQEAQRQYLSHLMGRVMQNVRFSRKFKISMQLASFAKTPDQMRAPHDVISLGVTLGMHQSEAKKSIQFPFCSVICEFNCTFEPAEMF